MRRTSVGLCALLAAVATASADGPIAPPPDARAIERATAAVVAAVRAKDEKSLHSLAEADGVDPWLVADALLAGGEAAAAGAFSQAASGRGGERLASYVEAFRVPPDDAARRTALDAAIALAAGKRWEEALLAAKGPATGADPAGAGDPRLADVVGIRTAKARAAALSGLQRRRDAASELLAAGAAARDLGWLAEATRSLSAGADLAKAAKAADIELPGREALLALAESRADGAAASAARADLGDVVRRLGEIAKARAILGPACDELRREGNPFALARASLDLAAALGEVGQFDEAFRLDAEARATFEKLGNAAGVAAAINNIGNLHNARGEYAEARRLHEEALSKWRAAKDPERIAAGLGNLGNDAAQVGQYARALECREEALALCQSANDRAGIAWELNGLSGVFEALGQRPKAFEFARRALSMAEEDHDPAAVAEYLSQVGTLAHANGDLEEALALFERELAIVEKGGNDTKTAQVLCNLGTVRFGRGEAKESRDLLERALALETRLGLSAAAVQTRSNLGVVLFRMGRNEEAAEALEGAVAEADRLRMDDRLAYSLGHLAGFRLATNDPVAALAAAKRGATIEARLVSGLSDEQGAFAREAHHGIYETGLLAAVATDDLDEGARFLELGRAGALREALLARRTARSAEIPPELAAAEEAARRAETQAIAAYRASLDGGGRAEVRARREEADAATAGVEAAIDRIQRAAKRGTSLVLPRVETVASLKARLGPNEAFITYSYAGAQAAALVVTRNWAKFVGLGKVEAVTRDCEDLHAADPGAPSAEMDDAISRIGGHLVRRFKLPDDVKRIYVSPDGATGYVPFALLFPGREIVYEPSFTAHGLLLAEEGARGEKILALGDPDYSAAASGDRVGNPSAPPPEPSDRSARDGRGARLVPLPATRGEAKSIGDAVLLGSQASESGLKAAIAAHHGRFRAIHFACHGILDPDHPARCSLALTASGKDDGYLTAREILETPIPADLVVLSACETAKGHVLRGEGILGLTRAFMYAGAPRVVCSLWKVDDEATRALMTKFYSLWNPKDGSKPMEAATALRSAQDYVKSQEKWKHPYYWAAWVLWGLAD